MWASAQNISGAGWSGMAEATSLDTMTQMNQAFRNIVNMLHGVPPDGGAPQPPAPGSTAGWEWVRRTAVRPSRPPLVVLRGGSGSAGRRCAPAARP